MKYSDMPNNSTYDDDIIFSNHSNAREITLEECIEFSKKKKNDAYNKTGNPVYNSDEYIKISNMSPDEWINYCREKKHKQDLDSLNDIGKAIPSPWNSAAEYYESCKKQYAIAKATGDKKRIKAYKEWLHSERQMYFRNLLRAASYQICLYNFMNCIFISIAYCILNFFIDIHEIIPLFILLLLYFIVETFRTFFRFNSWEEVKHLF